MGCAIGAGIWTSNGCQQRDIGNVCLQIQGRIGPVVQIMDVHLPLFIITGDRSNDVKDLIFTRPLYHKINRAMGYGMIVAKTGIYAPENNRRFW